MKLKAFLTWVARSSRTIAVTVIGGTLVIGGLAMLVLPGPGILVVLAGLAVLGTQYAWARRALDETKRRAREAKTKLRRKKRRA